MSYNLLKCVIQEEDVSWWIWLCTMDMVLSVLTLVF